MSGDEWTVTPEGKRYRHATVEVTVVVWDNTYHSGEEGKRLPPVTVQSMINSAVQSMICTGENAHGATALVVPCHASWRWQLVEPVWLGGDEEDD